jgi:hypothetical protein
VLQDNEGAVEVVVEETVVVDEGLVVVVVVGLVVVGLVVVVVVGLVVVIGLHL